MKISDIRKLSDSELAQFINKRNKKSTYFCEKCGTAIMGKDRRNISGTNSYGVNKKICSLCKDCYSDLIDYLGVEDIDWE